MTTLPAISPATPADQPLIETLLDRSFGIDRRTKSSYRLREGSAPETGLSLIVRDDEFGIAGAISFWPLRIGFRGTPALLLGPLAVHPRRQNRGIGMMLMREGLKRAETMGHGLVLLVGDEPYYGRLGFKRLPHDLLLMPGPLNRARFLYLELKPGALQPAAGLILPPWRHAELSAALAVPHGAHRQQQGRKTQQG